MTNISSTPAWRTGLRLTSVTALVLATGLVPLFAQKKAPERFSGGLTKEERIARMQAIHAEVSARLPQGHAAAPVVVDITQDDRDAIDNPVTTERVPQRIGIVKGINETVGKPAGSPGFQRGVLAERDDSFVWAVTITSPGAQAIRLHIENFSLPENAELFLLGDNGQADGPHVGQGRNGNGDFWTRSIAGDTGTIVVRFTGARPGVNKARTTFVVTEVGHIRGRPPKPQFQSHDTWPCSDNASCMVDAVCTNISAVEQAKDAVAKLEWIKAIFIYTCTGGLIADTDTSTDIPLMLSANHCFSDDISNLETFFFYTTNSCDGACPDSLVTGGTPPPADTVGMTVNATNSSSDYTIFTLSEGPPAGVVFLGWNATPVANTAGVDLYRISNPNFGPQVYSEHRVDTSSPECRRIPRGAWIYSKDMVGATMGGSSGSPVVNANGEIVGQLTGCCGFNCGDVCDEDNNWTIDGAFANYFSEVQSILDPGGGGGCTISENPEVSCSDGLDNDCDGAMDCSDADCSADPACTVSECTLGQTGDSCTTDADCCSNKCRGRPGAKTCRE